MLWNHFQTTFNYVADIYAPIQSRKVRKMKASWLTDAIKKSMNRQDYLKKITSRISALRRLEDFVDRQTLLSAYNAIVRPYFDYCCEVLGCVR